MPFRDPLVEDKDIVSVGLDKLIPGNLRIGQYIESSSYVGGDSGWRIDANGSAEFNNVTVRGDLIHPNLKVTNDGIFIAEETGDATQTIPKIRFVDEFQGDTASIHKRANNVNNANDHLVIRSLSDTFLETDNVIMQGSAYVNGAIGHDFEVVNKRYIDSRYDKIAEEFHCSFMDSDMWFIAFGNTRGDATLTSHTWQEAEHGGRYGYFNNYAWWQWVYSIPYDPKATYKGIIRCRQWTEPTDSTKKRFYAGIRVTDSDNVYITDHWFLRGGFSLTQTWETFTASWGASVTTKPDVNTRRWRPIVVVNSDEGDGSQIVDSFTVYKTG